MRRPFHAASVVDRYATLDATIAGVRFGRSELVRVSVAGANRDPAVFADPERFDLRRANLQAQPQARLAAGPSWGTSRKPVSLPGQPAGPAASPSRCR